MNDKYFLDTNVLVYSFDRRDPAKQQVSEALIARALETHEGVISSQVIQEFLNVAGSKFERTMSPSECRLYLDSVLFPLCEVFPSRELYREALGVREGGGFSFYDALIVAAALEAGCRVLYTEDLQDGRQIRDLTIRNPFAEPGARHPQSARRR